MASEAILIVDDETRLLETMSLILQHDGYHVTTAGHPHEGLRLLEKSPYDLMFLDLNMPDMHGIELLRKVRAQRPDMPILILTGNATLETAIDAVREGARDFLLKPVDPALIRARVAEVLAEAREPRRRREIIQQLRGLLNELSELDEGSTASHTALLPLASATASSRFLVKGPFRLDLHTRHLTRDDAFLALPPSAFDYMVTLARHAPDPVKYQDLVLQSQGYQVTLIEAKELVRWRMHQLRQLIEPDPKSPVYILTVRGVGYRLDV